MNKILTVLRYQISRDLSNILIYVKIHNIVNFLLFLIDVDKLRGFYDLLMHWFEVDIEDFIFANNVDFYLFEIWGFYGFFPLGEAENVLLILKTICQLTQQFKQLLHQQKRHNLAIDKAITNYILGYWCQEHIFISFMQDPISILLDNLHQNFLWCFFISQLFLIIHLRFWRSFFFIFVLFLLFDFLSFASAFYCIAMKFLFLFVLATGKP